MLAGLGCFPKHYHLIAETRQDNSIIESIRYLHSVSAKYISRLDELAGRKVWHQHWDMHITYPKSFLARLNYVHANAVKMGIVRNAELYEWCSAAWFASTAQGSFYKTVVDFPSDKVVVPDDF